MEKCWLDNKKVLITGASSGLGRELTKILILKHNCIVIGIGRSEDKFRSLELELKEKKQNLIYYLLDVSKEDSWVFLSKNDNVQDIDILINNAGILPPFENFSNFVDKSINTNSAESILDINTKKENSALHKHKNIDFSQNAKENLNDCENIKEKLDKVLNTNLVSIIIATAYLMPLIERSKTPAIINISSSAGLCALPGISLYSATKSAVKNFTECLQQEKNYYVGLICPGFTKTNIFRYQSRNSNNKLINFISTNQVKMTRKIYKAILHKKRRCVFGFDAKCMDTLYRLFPNLSLKFFKNILKKSKVDLFADVFENNTKN